MLRHVPIALCLMKLVLLPSLIHAEDGSTSASTSEEVVVTATTTDEETGEVRSVTYTVNGEEVSRYFTTTVDENGVTVVVETEGLAGAAITRETEAQKNGNGSFSAESVRTGANGETSSSSYEWMMNEMGYVRTGERTSQSGKVTTSEKTVSVDGEGSWTGSTNIVGPDGETYTVEATGQVSDGQVDRTKTATGPNGEEMVRTDSWTRTESGYTRSSETTGAKGFSSSFTRDVSNEGNGAFTVESTRSGTGAAVPPSATGSRSRGTKSSMSEPLFGASGSSSSTSRQSSPAIQQRAGQQGKAAGSSRRVESAPGTRQNRDSRSASPARPGARPQRDNGNARRPPPGRN